MMIIGLTGGIGMGKSTVAGMFSEHGIPGFNADEAVHRLQAKDGAAIPALDAAFPGVVHNGVLDRAALRSRVLADGAEMKKLEAIIHPMVQGGQGGFMETARRDGKRAVLLDVPLLFEGNAAGKMDKTIVVSCPRVLQIERVLGRGVPLADIEAIIARQMPDAEKRRRADYVIETGGTLDETRTQVARIIKELGL
jgi:dephospho-CoA kinase